MPRLRTVSITAKPQTAPSSSPDSTSSLGGATAALSELARCRLRFRRLRVEDFALSREEHPTYDTGKKNDGLRTITERRGFPRPNPHPQPSIDCCPREEKKRKKKQKRNGTTVVKITSSFWTAARRLLKDLGAPKQSQPGWFSWTKPTQERERSERMGRRSPALRHNEGYC